MAIVVKDRVKETFTTTGTADFTLGGASVGYQAFSAIGNTNFTYYAAVDPSTGAWEVGYGQYLTSGPTLTRDTILASSAAGAKISFGAGSKEVFCTYPASKAIYEEFTGNVLIDGGPLTVVGTGVTSYTSFGAALAEMYANETAFAQMYVQNLNSSTTASTDIVAYNDAGDGTNNFIDMGITSAAYSDPAFEIFTPGSGYVYNDGGELLIGSATDDVILFAGGVDAADEAVRIDKTTKALTTVADVNVGGALDVTGTADITGAATFGSTVTLNANPSLALEAATKQYVDNQVTAGLHIHEPVFAESGINLIATYVQGGATFNITDITSTTTVTTSVNHGLSVNDQIWLYNTAGNGLSINTAYFVFSTPAANQLTLSLTFGGTQITGLTNASGLTYNTRANSGVGATLTNAGTKAALVVDSAPLNVGNRVMVRLQTNGEENGVYVVTTVGTPDPGGTNWVLTRAADSNQVNPADPNGLGTGDYYFTQAGNINAGNSNVLTTEPNTMIIGYTPLTYTQFSGGISFVGGTNIDVTGQVISLTGVVAPSNGGTGVSTVSTGDLLYGDSIGGWGNLTVGAAYQSLVVNGSGTQIEWNAVALDQSGSIAGALPVSNGGTGITGYAQGEMLYANTSTTLDKVTANTSTTKKFLSQTGNGTAGLAPTWEQPAATDITGLAASATTDTTDANNITSGSLGTSRLSGSYTGVTGVGTLTAGTWQAATIAAIYGGTGLTSFTTGDLIYANSSTTLARLADVAVGNALISGGVAAAPSWGKIGLATHVNGTLPTANGGTNLTSFTANGVVYASSTSALATGSALTFDGTNFGIGTNLPSAKLEVTSNGFLAKFTGSGAQFQGIAIRNNFASASNVGSTFYDAVNENGATVGNMVCDILTDGSSQWHWDTQPAGTRTDRRVERLRIGPSGQLGIGGANYGTAGQVLTSGGPSAAPTWAAAGGGADISALFGGSTPVFTMSGTTMTVSSITGFLYVGSVIPIPAFSGTVTSAGTTLTVSAVTAGAIDAGSVVTFPNFSGTATSSGTTLTVATATAGALDVNTVINTNASFTASRAGTVMTVTAVASGGIHVGMVVSTLGTVASFGTGTGTTGTYNMTGGATGGSAARTGTGTATITALGTGTGTTGTYTTNRTYTYGTASAITTNSGNPQRTVSARGTGTGGTGTYTLTAGLSSATGTATAPSFGSRRVTAIGTALTSSAFPSGQVGTYTIDSNLTVSPSSTVEVSQLFWTCPADVTKVRAIVVGGGGGGPLGGCGPVGGYGGAGIGIYSVTPGTDYLMTIGFGGASGNPGGSGGTTSFASFLAATGGTGANPTTVLFGGSGVSTGANIKAFATGGGGANFPYSEAFMYSATSTPVSGGPVPFSSSLGQLFTNYVFDAQNRTYFGASTLFGAQLYFRNAAGMAGVSNTAGYFGGAGGIQLDWVHI